MTRYGSFVVLGAIFSAALLGAFIFRKAWDTPGPKEATLLSVTVVQPRLGRITETISATGMTIPREEIQIMTELSGVRVRDVLVDVGDSVRKGQKLAVLDGDSLAYQRLPLQSDYERARDAFARVDQIKDSGAVSKQLVLEKRAEMLAAKARLADAELSLKRTAIRAPEAGVVFERKAVIGGLVTASEPLFRIARRQEIDVEALVPESVLSALQPGQSASVTLTGQTAPIEGTIRLITPRVDRATRMAAIRIRLEGTQPVPVGLFAAARIVLSAHEGMLLPKTAIQHDGAGDFVWGVGVGSTVKRWPVDVTLTDENQVLVEVLPFYVRVVARAGAFLREGDRVRAVEGR